jgi:CMP-N-acetylneuraminic acid synthetase
VRNLDQEGVSILTGALGAVVMPRERSVDIDNAIDFDIVESIMEKGGK